MHGAGTSIKSGGIKLVLWAQTPLLGKSYGHVSVST